MTALLLALGLLMATPSHQTLVYYNARIALREGRAMESIQLWLLRNAIESESHTVSGHDADLRSVAWAALGTLGLCPDGYPKDDAKLGGAGLWPVATHNWVLKNMRRAPPGLGGSPFKAFRVGRQQRSVSLFDVLDATELSAVRFQRTNCYLSNTLMVDAGEGWSGELRDKRIAARVLRYLLRTALKTLDPKRTTGRAVLKARIFDLNLRLAGLAAKTDRRNRRKTRRAARRTGLSKTELADRPEEHAIKADSEEGRILLDSLTWSPDAWMALSSDRRQFLFAHARRLKPAPQALKLAIVDRLLEARRGVELQSWIAHFGTDDPGVYEAIWKGERGRRILSLDQATGFRERGVIALHRGVHALSAGQRDTALRAFAHALRWAEDARDSDAVRNLSRRWLSYVAAQFRVTDALFAMLRNVVPRADYSAVLEDQLWHAALSVDADSFERCVRHQIGRGALNRRADALRPLALGDSGAFTTQLAGTLDESPYFAQRFLRQFIERLEAQPADVRAKHLPMLYQINELLEEAVAKADGKQRVARALIDRILAVAEGVAGVADTASQSDKAHGLSPDREVYAGALRIAPSDALPWPFRVAEVQAPAVFTAITLRPEEWRDDSGALVFGWRVED